LCICKSEREKDKWQGSNSTTKAEKELIVMACNINSKLLKTVHDMERAGEEELSFPGTKIKVSKLVDMSVVFPSQSGNYIMPHYFWHKELDFELNSQLMKEYFLLFM